MTARKGVVPVVDALFYFTLADRMTALAGNLGGVFASFAIGTAILLGCHTGTGWVGAFFCV
jgi:hypothetical protein